MHGADLLVAQRDECGVRVPLLGKNLKLDLNIQDKALKKSLTTQYYKCAKQENPTVSHTTYKLGTLKDISSAFQEATVMWLLLSSLVVSETGALQSDMSQLHGPVEVINEKPRKTIQGASTSNSSGLHSVNDITPLTLQNTQKQKSPT